MIHNPSFPVNGKSHDSLTDEFCNAEKTAFGHTNDFEKKEVIKAIGGSFDEDSGMVLVMSLRDDHDVNILCLDSDYPLDKDPSWGWKKTFFTGFKEAFRCRELVFRCSRDLLEHQMW